jgi:replication factor C subunit 2/4
MRIIDVVGNEEAMARLRVIARDGNLPNMIITGPPGTGKAGWGSIGRGTVSVAGAHPGRTTSICCLARELLGAQFKDAVLELNASDDRKLEVVRGKHSSA